MNTAAERRDFGPYTTLFVIVAVALLLAMPAHHCVCWLQVPVAAASTLMRLFVIVACENTSTPLLAPPFEVPAVMSLFAISVAGPAPNTAMPSERRAVPPLSTF